jgi:hypothetical protein
MRRKTGKATYRLRNWREYNAALIQRGSLTLWVSEDALTTWHVGARTGRRGALHLYSDTAILCMTWLSAVYRLTLRATQGWLAWVLNLLKVGLSVPDYTTLGRRRRQLAVSLVRRAQGEPLHVVVDATGIQVYGEGEWKVRRHGGANRRTWRKLPIGVDEASGAIVAAAVTTFDFSDGQPLPDLLDQIGENIAQVSGDGAYDMREWLKRRFISAKHRRQSPRGAVRVSGSMATPATHR